MLEKATVLGDNQFIAYDVNTEIAKKVHYGIYRQEPVEKPEWAKVAEDVIDYGEEGYETQVKVEGEE